MHSKKRDSNELRFLRFRAITAQPPTPELIIWIGLPHDGRRDCGAAFRAAGEADAAS